MHPARDLADRGGRQSLATAGRGPFRARPARGGVREPLEPRRAPRAPRQCSAAARGGWRASARASLTADSAARRRGGKRADWPAGPRVATPSPAPLRPSPREALGARCWVPGSSRRLCAPARLGARAERTRAGRTRRPSAPTRAGGRRLSCGAAPALLPPPAPRPAAAPAPRSPLSAGRSARRRSLRRRLPGGPARRGDAGPDLRVGIRGRDPRGLQGAHGLQLHHTHGPVPEHGGGHRGGR